MSVRRNESDENSKFSTTLFMSYMNVGDFSKRKPKQTENIKSFE